MKKTDEFSDLDMDDVKGEITTPVIEVVSELPVDEWAECVKRLTEYQEESWICIPHGSKVEIHSLEECTNEKFFDWVNMMWPPAKKLNHGPEDYDDLEYREKTLLAIMSFHKSMTFPKTMKL